jgi:hypothetical protein
MSSQLSSLFRFVSQIENETERTSKGRLQAVLDSIKKNYFHVAFDAWKNDGIAVYIAKETILKEMAAKFPYLNRKGIKKEYNLTFSQTVVCGSVEASSTVNLPLVLQRQ